MKDAQSAVLSEEMSIFADQTHVKEMLHEYLRRVLLNKPDDPISFLMDEIKRDPFVIPTLKPMPDDRPEEEKAKHIDARPAEEKMALLKDIFDKFDTGQTGSVVRAEMLVGFMEDKSILLSSFPKHTSEIPQALELLDCGKKEGTITFEKFADGMMECLAVPGGR
eukprot:CAMPEP_0205905856 /NCGR_PEP_ID=MMETSP1325-20131115/1596_1 /ASSEMBLY_ACC=CAM_ASM_000708 /TAXON_ID=236786 /ORGANISM="Florenciella sp., Strain RCC1007" /LENGTH=164 /DNA_ID=CAMNT_0053271807 /DNA_START=90 /DNA_END=584 /DNA_ORIENTATION=+